VWRPVWGGEGRGGEAGRDDETAQRPAEPRK